MNDLDQYTEQALMAVSPLLIESQRLLTEATAQTITHDEELMEANAIKKEINAHTKAVKDLRLNLTRPVDDFKKQIIAKEAEVLEPAEDAKSILGNKILAYEEELELQREIEEKRVDGLVQRVRDLYSPGMTAFQVGTGRTAAKALMVELGEDAHIPRVKLALVELSNNFAARLQDIEVEEQRQKKQKLQDDQTKIDAENRRIAAEQARIDAEREAQERIREVQRAERDRPKSNIVEITDFEITDEYEVDRLLCSPDPRKIREYIKAFPDKEIAGVRIFKTKKVR